MIELNNVTIQKGKRTIFDNVNLTFEPGKSYALIGHSGSGEIHFTERDCRIRNVETR